FCFTRNGQRSFVYYWHYTLEPPTADGLSPLQRVYQRRTRALPSVTLSVFTTAKTPEDLNRAAEFVRQVDEQLHAPDRDGRSVLPPGARMGSDTLPIRYVGPAAGNPAR
ncbi:MAG TPA: hypothetical protein VFA26_12515, partial [Gemmataceae bacterium]|nr:hypothetical protein [Gemmataceae bacterium]